MALSSNGNHTKGNTNWDLQLGRFHPVEDIPISVPFCVVPIATRYIMGLKDLSSGTKYLTIFQIKLGGDQYGVGDVIGWLGRIV